MTHIRARAALSAVIIAVTGALAGAVDAADAPSADPGEAAIQRGLRLRRTGDDAGAFPEFQSAYQLTHTPRAAAQLGLVEQALGHWDDAEVHLTEAVRATGDAWVEKNRPALHKSLALVKDHVGTLQVTGEPEGADIFVNGRRWGRIPMSEPVSVMAGDVDVEVRASGYRRAAQKVTIAAHEFRPLVVRLDRLDGARDSDRVGRPPAAPIEANRGAVATRTVPSEALAVPGEPPGSAWPIVGWSLAGAGAVTGLVGVIVAITGQSRINAASADADRANATANPVLYMSAAAKFSQGSGQRTTGRGLMIAGGAVAVAGLVLALTAGHTTDAGGASAARLQPSIDLAEGRPTSAGLSMTGTW